MTPPPSARAYGGSANPYAQRAGYGGSSYSGSANPYANQKHGNQFKSVNPYPYAPNSRSQQRASAPIMVQEQNVVFQDEINELQAKEVLSPLKP